MIERTLLLLKPEAIKHGLIGEVIKRVEKKKFKIVALKMLKMNRSQAEKFYEVHRNKPFFNKLIRAILAGPVIAMIVERENAIDFLRELIGATDPAQAKPGTIRGDLGISITLNIVHASTREEAEREIAFFFPEESISSQREDK